MNLPISRLFAPEKLRWTWGKPSLRGILRHAGKSLVLELIAWRYRKLASIVKLHYSADQAYRQNGFPTLALVYDGPGDSEQEAREDLKQVQFTFNTLLDHGSPEYIGKYSSKPDSGILQGKGKVLGRPFWIWLRVPWLPPGCEIEESTGTQYKAVCQVE